MSRCKRCMVEILDDAEICPLCGNVLTREETDGNMHYPNVSRKTKALKRVVNALIYAMIVIEVVLCVVNYYMDDRISWSAVTGVCIAYAAFTTGYFYYRKNSHIRKIFSQSLTVMLLLIVLDALTGMEGWSIVYGLPCAVLLLDVILVVCMLVNLSHWQSYLLVQIFSLLVSVGLLLLYLFGYTKSPVLPWVSFGTSAVIFSFCCSMGYRKAKSELKKRFYI